MKEKENQWVTLEASWPQAPSRTPMGCPAGVRTFTWAPNIVPIKTEVGAQLHPGKPRGQGGRRGGLTPTLQGSVCRLFRITEAESKRAPQGKGREGCTACLFHCCFVSEFWFGDNRSTMLLVSAAQQRGSAVGIHMPLPLGLPPQPTHPWVSTEHPEELCAARRFPLTAYPHALLYKRQG